MLSEIEAITEQQILRLAQDLLAPETMALTVLGPLSARQMAAMT
jgi:predicted Zn-dependent peptidase